MSTAYTGVEGFSPELSQGTGNPEALKYGKLWDMEAYRKVSPGEDLAKTFLEHAKPTPGSTLIDFGCGTGRGGFMLSILGGMKVTFLDFTRNCLDKEIREACDTQPDTFKFVKKDLEHPIDLTADYGYCCDVLEHIPEEKVQDVINHILMAGKHVFFSISTTKDACGELIGEELHLTVKNYNWWLEKFWKAGCVIHWSDEVQGAALFYVSNWCDGKYLVDNCSLNEEITNIRANVEVNCAGGWNQVVPHPTNDMEVMMLGGGWSLPQFVDDIKQKRAEGVKLITLNGSYNWALEHGLTPSATILVDARPFNARFTKPVVGDCKYLIASQCHPSVLEGLPKDRTYLWHTMIKSIEDLVKKHYDTYYPVPSCTTVLNTSIMMLRQLGFKRFHLYGCDSCLAPDKVTHHAYSQPENDEGFAVPVTVSGGRTFWCNPWMVAQAQQFMDMIKMMKDEVEIEIYGDGLLKHILDVGASILPLNEGE